MKTTILGGMIMSLAILGFVPAIACSPSSNVAPSGTKDGDASGGLHTDDEAAIPCAPRRVLKTVCQKCHTQPTANGAPFALVRRSDVLRIYGGVPVRELMIEQLTAGRMPLSPVTIEADDRETLLEWLRAGAPASAPDSCNDAGTTGALDAGDDTGTVEDGGPASDGASDADIDGGAADAESEAGQW